MKVAGQRYCIPSDYNRTGMIGLDGMGWDGMGWDGVRLGSNRVLSTIFVARAVYPCVDLT